MCTGEAVKGPPEQPFPLAILAKPRMRDKALLGALKAALLGAKRAGTRAVLVVAPWPYRVTEVDKS